ncbi:MAG TPA: glycoside hydrolase family 15 protein [Candidatus Limnocylindrales bacterium]|jgi:GH15 family glucan-1,4-alpha-glucosidase|nr:glycoside hydrolase family 15 protein [Candidatus Limnocylindrales bacterium]
MTTPDLVAASIDVIAAGQAENGAFIAGPTFSQYGYAWLRDGAFIAEALDLVGQHARARRFHEWVTAVIRETAPGIERSIEAGRDGRRPVPADYLHCRYTVDGDVGPEDWPTFQLDGPGIWLWSLGRHVSAAGEATFAGAVADAALLAGRYLAALWPVPSADAWEEFPEHVHTSTLAADLAGLRALLKLSPRARAEPTIVAAEAAIASRLRDQGTGDGAWTKWTGTDAVDASLLWIAAPFGLVPPTDPRFAATLDRIETELVSVDGGVHRYVGDTYYGGGEWLLLTASLGRVYLRRNGPGDRDRAVGCLGWVEAQAGSGGVLPEQVAARALQPALIDGWRRSWGESACPLLWSHATYLSLRAELGAPRPDGA